MTFVEAVRRNHLFCPHHKIQYLSFAQEYPDKPGAFGSKCWPLRLKQYCAQDEQRCVCRGKAHRVYESKHEGGAVGTLNVLQLKRTFLCGPRLNISEYL